MDGTLAGPDVYFNTSFFDDFGYTLRFPSLNVEASMYSPGPGSSPFASTPNLSLVENPLFGFNGALLVNVLGTL